MSEPVGGGASPESMQVGEIEDQMRNQERILAQLHESIIAQDKQLLGREAEAQSYASKLENLKSRHSRDQIGPEQAIPGTSVRVAVPKAVTPKSSGSLTLLRQKVEENRVKVAQRGRQELESKRELEERVQSLKSQLEEMQKVPAAPTVPNQNIVDTRVIVLQEQIQAKDSLIEARTRAITLLSEDFSRKRKEVVDQLEETREEMRLMQKNFIICEDHYKAEIQARDNRLFELDTKVRALNVKHEQAEELGRVLADNEYLQGQIKELNCIKEEKQCLEDKLQELLSLQAAHLQKEVEMSLLLEEKHRLHQHKVEELANIYEANQQKEEKLTLLLEEKRRLQNKVEELTNLSKANQQKGEELSFLLEEKQRLQNKLEELTNLSKANQQKEHELSLLLDEKQRLQNKVEELTNLYKANQQKEKELSLLLEEKQRLQDKVEELTKVSDVNRQKEEELSVHLKKNQSLQKMVEKLTRLLAANEKKVKEMNVTSNTNRQYEEEVSTLTKEKQSLEGKVEELSRLLDANQQKERAESLEKNIILVGANSQQADEMVTLLKEKHNLQKKLETLTGFLGDIRQEKDLSSQLPSNKLDELVDLARQLCANDQKVGDLHCFLDTNQHNEIGSVLIQEKVQLEQKLEQCSALLQVYRETLKNICSQTQGSDNFQTEVLEEQTVVENINKTEMEELSRLVDVSKHNKEEQELLARLLDASELRMKEQSLLLSTSQLKEEELLKELCNYEKKCRELTITLENKEALEDKVDELSKIVDANQHQHKEELLIVVQEKQLLQDRVQELSHITEANDQSIQAMNEHLNASQQQRDQELATLLQEKQCLVDKVQELSNLIEINKQDMQGIQDHLDANQQLHNDDMSALLNEKQLLHDKINELSGVIANNNKDLQGMEDAFKASKQQQSANLTVLLEKTHLLESEAQDYSALLMEKELLQDRIQQMSSVIEAYKENLQRMDDNLSNSEERYGEMLSETNKEKQLLQNKVQELSKMIENNEHNLQQINEQLNISQQQLKEELLILLTEKHLLEEKVQQMSNLTETNEENLQRMNANLSMSKQQHYEALSELDQEKQFLQNKVHELSNIITTNEQYLQQLDEQLNISQQQFNEERSIFETEKQQLQDKVQELSNLIETKDQNLQIMHDNLSSNVARHYEALSELSTEKQFLQDKVQELSNILATNEQNMVLMNERVYTLQQQHNKENSILVTEKHVLQEKVRELSNLIETNEDNLQRLNDNLNSNEEQRQFLQDKVQELSKIIETNEQNLQGMNNLLIENMHRVEELSTLLQIANQDKTSLKEEIEQLTQASQHQMSEWSSYMQEKQSLHDQVAELSNLLDTSQKEKLEEVGHILQDKNNLESEVKRLSKLIEEGKEKQKLALSKAHKKITDLKRHVNSLEKADDSSAIMVDLQNRIAELEEEKGNLQLHLVDFEELKALGSDLTAQVESLHGQKVTAEMRSLELEEELDNLKIQPGYLEDQAVFIDTLESKLRNQVESYELLNQLLMKCSCELSDTKAECERLINALKQTEENNIVLKDELSVKEAKLLNLTESLSHAEASFDEILKTTEHMVNNVDKFCSEIFSGIICEVAGESALMVKDTMQVAVTEDRYSVQVQEMNAKLGELLSSMNKARTSLHSREMLVGTLQTELSQACGYAVNLETRLRQLEYCENESVRLRNEVDRLKCLLDEKQREGPPSVAEEVNISLGDTELDAWQPEETVIATRSHLQGSTPDNAASATHVYESRIQKLEQDKARLTEELKSAQVRCGKLIKKIKTLKTDYDSLVDKNFKLIQEANLASSSETEDKMDSLEKEVGRLQLELQKRDRQTEEASTQADDDQLTWLSNEYESVKLEIQHLIEEIQTKDATLLEVTGELQSKRDQSDELLEEVARLREMIGAREVQVAGLEELLLQHGNKNEPGIADDRQTFLLRQKDKEIAHLEELLRQRSDGDREGDPPHRQLDESLYMLHQKEVRCDELTLELMQLLEERDTLQLRLSTTIRQYEDLRASCAHADNTCTSTPSTTPNNSPVLSNKLQEVRSMGREQRSMALQQRADATVSRDNQSQSETLINWIRGRTTPKVMHI